MKILKKTIALFLVVVLAASAFCLEAFALTDSGSYENRTWNASLQYQNNKTKATADMSWYGSGTVSVSWYCFAYEWYGTTYYQSGYGDGGFGSARFSRTTPSGTAKYNYLYAEYKIRTKHITTLIL